MRRHGEAVEETKLRKLAENRNISRIGDSLCVVTESGELMAALDNVSPEYNSAKEELNTEVWNSVTQSKRENVAQDDKEDFREVTRADEASETSTGNMISRRHVNSPVWEFYEKMDLKCAKCKLCEIVIRTLGGTTTSLISHILGVHKGTQEAGRLRVMSYNKRMNRQVSKVETLSTAGVNMDTLRGDMIQKADDQWQCKVCGDFDKDESVMEKHVDGHLESSGQFMSALQNVRKEYPCSYCHQGFKSKRALKEHILHCTSLRE